MTNPPFAGNINEREILRQYRLAERNGKTVSNLTKRGMNDSNANYIPHDLYEQLKKEYEPKQGEILLSKDATPGLAFYLERAIQGIVPSGILRLSIIAEIPPHYLELVLNSMFCQTQIEQDAGGSIIKHWKPSQVKKTLIPRLDKKVTTQGKTVGAIAKIIKVSENSVHEFHATTKRS